MGLGLGLGIQFKNSLGRALSEFLTWGQSIPARFWGTESPEYWGGIDAQAEVHYNRVIADGGVVPAGLGGVNSFFQVVKEVYGTSDINTAISAAYDAHYLGYKLGAGSGTTLGQAAQKLYAPKGIFGGIGTGSAYYDGTGVAGNFISTPNAAAMQIIGDIEDIYYFDIQTVSSIQSLFSCGDSGFTSGYNVYINASGVLIFDTITRGQANCSVSISTGLQYIKITRTASNGNVNFFRSLDGVSYTQLGTTQSTTAGNLIAPTNQLVLGIFRNLSSFPFQGKIYRATRSNSIGGTPVVDFNANQYTGANTWTSTTSEVWTVNSTGAGLADVTQTTAASQPLLLAHTGENYYFNSIAVGNNVTTPIKITSGYNGEYEIQAYIKPLAITASTSTIFTAGTNASLGLFLQNAGVNKRLCIWLNGGTGAATTNTIDVSTFNGWIKAYRTAVNVRFETSTDGINWTLFENVAIPNTSYTLTGVTTIGNYSNSDASAQFAGNIYRVRVWINGSSSTGTLTYDFNPASYNPATSQTQWSSATGEVWTINTGTATTGYKAVLVDRTRVQTDGIDDQIFVTTLSTGFEFTNYNAITKMGVTGGLAGIHLFESTLNLGSYYTNTTTGIIRGSGSGGDLINFNGFTQNVLQLFTWGKENSSNGAGDILEINNINQKGAGSRVNNNTANTIIIGRWSSLFGQFSFNTFIMSKSLNNSTQRTAMYNALKSYNNNAF